MNKNLTDITVCIDRSGSMSTTRKDAEGGLNAFIEEQKKGTGVARLTLVQFDDKYEVVYSAKPLNEVPEYTLNPRGGTALLDAVGKAIVETGIRLSNMNEADRPGLVVFVIITDGGENSSREYTKTRIKEMVDEQTNKFSWAFQFLGSNQDGFSEGRSLGIGASATYTGANTVEAFGATSKSIGRMRGMSMRGEAVVNGYTTDELKSMVNPTH